MVEASSQINGSANNRTLVVRLNERLNLTCAIEAPQKTDFVYWYRNNQPVQFDNWKSRDRLKTRRHTVPSGAADNSDYDSNSHLGSDEDGEAADNNDDDDDDSSEFGRKHVEPKKKETKKSTKRIENRQHVKASAAAYSSKRQRGKKNNYDGIKFIKSRSALLVEQASLNDTGNYSCFVSSLEFFTFRSARQMHNFRSALWNVTFGLC